MTAAELQSKGVCLELTPHGTLKVKSETPLDKATAKMLKANRDNLVKELASEVTGRKQNHGSELASRESTLLELLTVPNKGNGEKSTCVDFLEAELLTRAEALITLYGPLRVDSGMNGCALNITHPETLVQLHNLWPWGIIQTHNRIPVMKWGNVPAKIDDLEEGELLNGLAT